MTIDPIRVEPVGDDQQWKRDLDRLTKELIAVQAAHASEIAYLKGRVN